MGSTEHTAAMEQEALEAQKLNNEGHRAFIVQFEDCNKSQRPIITFGRFLAFVEGIAGIALATKVGIVGSANYTEDVALALGLLVVSAATQWVVKIPCFKFMTIGPGTGDKTPPPPPKHVPG